MTIPNQLTFLRILLSPVFLYFFFSPNPNMKIASFFIFTLAAITDWYDGWIARKYGYITTWGKFFDPLADKVLTSCAFFAFYSIGILDLWMFLIIIIRDIFITLLRSIAELKERPIVTTYSAKVKTFIQMSVLFYVLFFYSFKNWIEQNFNNLMSYFINPFLIFCLMFLVTVFTIYTGIMYLIDNWKTISKLYETPNRI